MRVRMGYEILSMWQNLGKTAFIKLNMFYIPIYVNMYIFKYTVSLTIMWDLESISSTALW